MQYIRKVGTMILCGIMTIGFIVTILTSCAYFLRMGGNTNVIVCWLTQNAAVDFSWTNDLKGKYNKYDKHKSIIERYESIVEGMENSIEDFCTSAFPKNPEIKEIADAYQHYFLRNNLESKVGKKTNTEYAEEAYNYVHDFYKYLTKKEIDFTYIQLPEPTRISAIDGENPKETLDIPDKFTNLMEKSDIPFINICDYKNELNEMSLDATEHWMPIDALKSTTIIVTQLNDRFGYEFDESKYDSNCYYNVMDLNPRVKKNIQEDFGYSYELWVPNDSPEYYVDYCEEEIYEGDFLTTLLNPISSWDRRIDDGSGIGIPIAYHNMWLLNNGAYVDIKNLSNNNNPGKKILVLGDSYSWPITSYLSEDVEEIVAFHPRFFPGDVKTYIDSYQPDLVIWLHNECQVGSENDLNFGKVE